MTYRPLIDYALRLAIEDGWIQNIEREQVNPASVNLRVGNTAMVETGPALSTWGERSEMRKIDITSFSSKKPYWVNPGAFVLCDVQEVLALPRYVEAEGKLRSSAARLGWDHAAALYVDPGYHGRLTLEFVNCRQGRSLPLFPGLELVQLRLFSYGKGNGPLLDYSETGRYHNAQEVEANKDLLIQADAA
ncbi:MAG: dCTP deaminase [Synechococcus sp.]